MTRKPADPVGRLAKLQAARKGCRPKTFLNAEDMAAAAGMTWRNLRQIIDRDPAFPVKARGDMGVPWEFDARAVLDHLIGQARAAQAERGRRTAQAKRLAGLGGGEPVCSLGGDSTAGSGSAAEMLDEARALNAFLDVQTKVRAERERQNALLDREPVQSFLWRWVSALQSRVLATKNRIDKAGTLPPEVRARLGDELDLILVDMHNGLEKEIERQNAPRP